MIFNTAAGTDEMSTITSATKVHASRDHVACDLEDETVLLSLRTGEYFGLNEVAASVWKLIQEPRTVEEILAGLLQEFEADDVDRCRKEVIALVKQLMELELVSISI